MQPTCGFSCLLGTLDLNLMVVVLVVGYESVLFARQASHHHAQGYAACSPYPRRPQVARSCCRLFVFCFFIYSFKACTSTLSPHSVWMHPSFVCNLGFHTTSSPYMHFCFSASLCENYYGRGRAHCAIPTVWKAVLMVVHLWLVAIIVTALDAGLATSMGVHWHGAHDGGRGSIGAEPRHSC